MSKNTTIAPSDSFNKKFKGTAPLKWCPECGQSLVASQISISGGKQAVSGLMCKVCGYIHNCSIK